MRGVRVDELREEREEEERDLRIERVDENALCEDAPEAHARCDSRHRSRAPTRDERPEPETDQIARHPRT